MINAVIIKATKSMPFKAATPAPLVIHTLWNPTSRRKSSPAPNA
jgi:hypothetical protein